MELDNSELIKMTADDACGTLQSLVQDLEALFDKVGRQFLDHAPEPPREFYS
ncbi:MAG: hypothetical protein HQL82_03695 [Magnetococcales bacterium]|nr:hypothetical protein [Magnetococcales bacterium]